MPIRSMTGFGQMEKQTSVGMCRVEVRAVNGRYLETQLRSPRIFANLDARIKKQVSEKISRGSLSVYISCGDQAEEKGRLTWDKAAVESYVRIFREINDAFGFKGEITLSDLLRFSDFIKSEVVGSDDETLWSELEPIITGALKDFEKSREDDARLIIRDFELQLGSMRRALKTIEERAPIRLAAYVQESRKRIEQLLGGAEGIDPQRLASEAAFMADKLDITEECTRLAAHLDKFAECLTTSEPVGKRMNFVVQEMNREASTIASKANDTTISHLSVELRESIEKIREQIQNIE